MPCSNIGRVLGLNDPPAWSYMELFGGNHLKGAVFVDQARGLHSFTSQLNVSAFYAIGGAHRGYPGVG